MIPAQVTKAAEPLGQRYQAVLRHAVEVLAPDDRVRALFVSGSVGRGVADAASDLDLLIVAGDDTLEGLLAAPMDLVASVVGATVLARRLGFGHETFTTITPTWERIDLMVVPASSVTRFRRADVVEVFDRDDIGAQMSSDTSPPKRDLAAIALLCEEFLRVLGLLDVILAREEYLVGVEAVGLLRGHLRDLFVQESNLPVVGGVKRLNPRLTPEQRSTLAGLPPTHPVRESVIEGHMALAALFLPRARRLCEELQIPWPEAFDAATRQHLAERLGVAVPA